MKFPTSLLTDVPAEPATPEPVCLNAVEQFGAVRFGRPVAKMVLVYADGKRLSVDLPEPGTAEPAHDSANDPTQRRVLAALTESPIPLTRKQIAVKLGRQNTTGRFGELLREAIGSLLSGGLIFETGGIFSNDANKFESTT